MPIGSVKWFDTRKGYGFIIGDDPDKDIFVHYSQIDADGFRSLKDGESVEFELVETDKGLQARSVRRMSDSSLKSDTSDASADQSAATNPSGSREA